MANTPTREHREAAVVLAGYGRRSSEVQQWIEDGQGSFVFSRTAQALADAEQRGYERGLADRDERCLQSDMQRIREKLAFKRGMEKERAEVTAYVYQELGDDADQLLIDINMGKHLAKEE